ncbi:MAG TPA: hypothetical protein PKK15_05925 [Kouleothrix sp.]|nr:hypothetical protein [Kouleothrix sp.]
MATFPIAHLRDTFDDNLVNPCWNLVQTGSATGSETGAQAVFTLPSSVAGSHAAYYESNANYDLTGDGAATQVGTMVATGVAATAFFQLILDANNYLEMSQLSNAMRCIKVVGGVSTILFTATWSSTNHKYWRIRESSGTIYCETSANGTSWTNRASLATPFAVTDLTVRFGATCGNVASPGSFKLDMFNLILPAPTSTWRWTDADWQIVNRLRPITLASTGNMQGVIVVAGGKDSANTLTGNVYYFGGPVGSASGGYAALTQYASLAEAQNTPFTIPADGRVDLPALFDGRIVRLYHRSSDGASGTLREFVPRRIVQADDVEAESIRAINIAAGTITADKIYAAFTITGKRVQTAESGARVVLSGDANGGFIGYGAADTYDPVAGSGTYQARWSLADGKLYAGGGSTVIDATGIHMVAPTISAYDATRSVSWAEAGGAIVGYVQGYRVGSPAPLSVMNLYSKSPSGAQEAWANLVAENTVNGTIGSLYVQTSGANSLAQLNVTNTYVNGVLNVSGVANANAGLIAAVSDAITNVTSDVLQIKHSTSGTAAAGFGSAARWLLESSTTADQNAAQIDVTWDVATHASRRARMMLYAYDAAGARNFLTGASTGAAPTIGFLGATPAAQQTGGAATAGASYTATEQGMLQKAYNALRTFGLLT